ncbi:hypothetical protein FRC09_005656, partial [Ceratobasidium sp. 395]
FDFLVQIALSALNVPHSAQERQAYEERRNYSAEMARLYQDPQLWVSISMGDIMDRPVEI